MLPSRSSAPERKPWDLVPSSQARWTPHKGQHRACGECVQMLHAKARTAAPDPARLKRKVGDLEWFLCSTHGQARRENDDDAKAAAKVAAARGRSR
ncbi:hypothetical protein [Micromonospora maritima]|uniref:hypothetical protein n=1 Tax=Micromonospora maritima TaxID=986711 RepID=UPI00157D3ECB|nr:hypothetical protein [Micromonospora maritima]